MGRGTWYYSLGVFLEIVDVFVRSEFGISSWRGSRVDGRSYLLSGAIDGSEANRIIRDSKQEVWNDCMSCKVRVGSNGNLLWEASVLLGRKVHEDDVAKTIFRMRNEHVEVTAMPFGLTNAPTVFMELMSRRKLSRYGRNQMVNESILALPKGADDFVVYYDARSKDLKQTWKKKGRRGLSVTELEFDFEAKYHLGKANVDVVPSSMKKNIASCGSKYLACSRVEIEYQWSSRLLLQPETCLVDVRGSWVTVLWAVIGESELNESNLVSRNNQQDVGMMVEGFQLGAGCRVWKERKLVPNIMSGTIGDPWREWPIVRLEISVYEMEYLQIDGEDLEDVGITVNRSDGDISEEVECTNTERHDDYDALNLFRLLLKSIDDHVLAYVMGIWTHLVAEVSPTQGMALFHLHGAKCIYYTNHAMLQKIDDAYSKISKLYTVCEKVNPNLERSSKALENAFWLLSQKLAEED
ncbi:hypothetical protein Tco_1345498 [Tanacetum coccineum]